MDIIIRKALPEDKYTYADCYISCLQTAYRGIVPDDFLNNLPSEKEKRAKRLLEYLENPDLAVFFTEREDKMLGFLILHLSDGEIWAIYLLEELRGKGYGKTVMDFAVNGLKNAGQENISLWVLEENYKARRFYEKYGFRHDGTKKENANYGKPLMQFKYVLN